jgi:hypothetical protein
MKYTTDWSIFTYYVNILLKLHTVCKVRKQLNGKHDVINLSNSSGLHQVQLTCNTRVNPCRFALWDRLECAFRNVGFTPGLLWVRKRYYFLNSRYAVVREVVPVSILQPVMPAPCISWTAVKSIVVDFVII